MRSPLPLPRIVVSRLSDFVVAEVFRRRADNLTDLRITVVTQHDVPLEHQTARHAGIAFDQDLGRSNLDVDASRAANRKITMVRLPVLSSR